MQPDSLGGAVARETIQGPTVAEADAEHISLVGLVTVVLRRRHLIWGIAALTSLATLALVIGQRVAYTTTTTFIPQSTRPTSNFAGIASQFNINIDGGQAGESPAFYVELVNARAILDPVVDSTYTDNVDGVTRTGSLIEVLRIPRGGTLNQRRNAAVEKLRQSISASAAPRTGVISVAVTADSPNLAFQIATQLLNELNQFNLVTRQTQAGTERRFAAQRLEDVRNELRQAEDRELDFLQTNRDYARSPQLVLEHERIMRDVDLRQQLQLTLVQSYERAKIDEVRDTPVITVIDKPDMAAEPDRRGRLKKLVAAAIVGAVLGTILAFLLEYFSQAEFREAEQHFEFATLRREVAQEFLHPWASLRRAFRRGPN